MSKRHQQLKRSRYRVSRFIRFLQSKQVVEQVVQTVCGSTIARPQWSPTSFYFGGGAIETWDEIVNVNNSIHEQTTPATHSGG